METSVQEDRKVDWSVLDADAAYLILIKKPRGELKHLIYELQPELWKVERALNVPVYESLKLEKGWALKTTHELAEIAAIILPSLERAKREHAEMEATYGKADDLRKQIEVKVREYEALCREANVVPTFLFPKGFRFMSSLQLQEHLNAANGCVEYAQKRIAGKRAEAEIRAQHELELKRINDERNARRDLRKAELDAILRPYTETVTKILEHPVFRSVSVKLPMLQLDRFTVEFQLGTLGEEGYQLLLNKARAEITTNQRKLREPMRRAHQSAQSRGITKLGFEDYLRKEGFEHLLK